MRRTIGNAMSRVGKATSHEKPHALGHMRTKSEVNPRLRAVEIAETTHGMRIERTSGITNAAARAGRRYVRPEGLGMFIE